MIELIKEAMRKSQIAHDQLDDLLMNRRKYPWTQEEFMKYLRTVYSDENFEFMVEFQKLRKKDYTEETAKASELLFNKFVAKNSEKQLNISSVLRENAEVAYKEDPTKVDEIYKQIYDEARKLIISGLHVQRFHEKTLESLDSKSSDRRIYACILFFLIALLVSLLLIFLVSDRWVRLYSFPLWYIFTLFTSFRAKNMCPIAARKKLRSDQDTKELIQLEDYRTIIEVNLAEKQLHFFSIFSLIGILAIILSLPVLP